MKFDMSKCHQSDMTGGFAIANHNRVAFRAFQALKNAKHFWGAKKLRFFSEPLLS